MKKPIIQKKQTIPQNNPCKTEFNELVSVIIPSYNRYDSLLTSIRSIKEQTHRNFEIIVINDGSEDTRYDSLPDLGVKYIKIEHTGLHMVAMNRGIEKARGKYLAFLDDDDIWFPTKVEKQIKCLRNSNCKMSSTNARVGSSFWSYDKDVSTHQYFKEKLPIVLNRDILKITNYCMNSSVILEKELVLKVGMFKEDPIFRHCADYDLWLRVMNYTGCIYLNEPLIYYRDNRTNSSMRYGHGGASCDEVNEKIAEFERNTGRKFKDIIGC